MGNERVICGKGELTAYSIDEIRTLKMMIITSYLGAETQTASPEG